MSNRGVAIAEQQEVQRCDLLAGPPHKQHGIQHDAQTVSKSRQQVSLPCSSWTRRTQVWPERVCDAAMLRRTAASPSAPAGPRTWCGSPPAGHGMVKEGWESRAAPVHPAWTKSHTCGALSQCFKSALCWRQEQEAPELARTHHKGPLDAPLRPFPLGVAALEPVSEHLERGWQKQWGVCGMWRGLLLSEPLPPATPPSSAPTHHPCAPTSSPV